MSEQPFDALAWLRERDKLKRDYADAELTGNYRKLGHEIADRYKAAADELERLRETLTEIGDTEDARIAELESELSALKRELDLAERALQRHGYRKSCNIPACNCGDQWNHGGHAYERLREIADEVNGRTVLQAVRALKRENEALKRDADKFGDGIDWIERALKAEAECDAATKRTANPDNASLDCEDMAAAHDAEKSSHSRRCTACDHWAVVDRCTICGAEQEADHASISVEARLRDELFEGAQTARARQSGAQMTTRDYIGHDDSDWSDRWTPEELAERVDLFADECAVDRGWYETAAILRDAAAALRSMEGQSD